MPGTVAADGIKDYERTIESMPPMIQVSNSHFMSDH